jgi:hypothetical protein
MNGLVALRNVVNLSPYSVLNAASYSAYRLLTAGELPATSVNYV